VRLDVTAEVAAIVRPVAFASDHLVIRERAPALGEALETAAAAARGTPPDPEVTAAVRIMYRRMGLDPTKTRPSSEALLRRVRRGEPLPRINSLVDVINWCSLESQLPFGLYDRDRIEGVPVLRLGLPGEQYDGIRRDVIHVQGRLVVADDRGAFGNPTADSARTMITTAATHALVVIFAPAQLPPAAADRAAEMTRLRIDRYCRG
jgi:DNA/RNA-binding domain of Phe-tRNA-synthetase-like protein